MQLAITAIGKNQWEITTDLPQVILDCNCSILELRVTALGRKIAAHLLVEGNWNHVARLESLLEALSLRCGFKIHACRTEDSKSDTGRIPYTIDAITSDRTAVAYEVAAFLKEHNILIHEFSASRYPAPHTGAPVFVMHIIISIPADLQLISLRDEFLDFCDRLNIDAILEPLKR